jgi:acyl carrier protein
MDKNEIIKKISNRIAKEILSQPERVIKDAEPLITSGLIDSFHLVDLALMVEDEFGVHIDDTELNSDCFDNLDQLSGLIQSRIKKS